MTRRPRAGGAGFATRRTAEVRTIIKTRRNDRRTSMEHLDETAFSFECAEAQRSISFLEVSGYACVSLSLNFCGGPGAKIQRKRNASVAADFEKRYTPLSFRAFERKSSFVEVFHACASIVSPCFYDGSHFSRPSGRKASAAGAWS